MSDIDLFIEGGYGTAEERAWAINVRSKFVTQQLDRICGGAGHLPWGITAGIGDVDVVVALGFADNLSWSGHWNPTKLEFDDAIPLTTEEVAFTIDAIDRGAVGLALRAACPVAVLGRSFALTAATAESAANAKFFAVVDELDRSAVLELLAILPGPVVLRRHDGKWERDNAWVRALKSVRPPPVVTLDPEMMNAVAVQVDEATKGKPFKAATASGFDQRLHEMQIEWMCANSSPLTAAMKMPAKLQRYWLTGKGAARIRWGTPGAFRRCQRQLRKYLPLHMVDGACGNLSKKLGGPGVATHVGD